MKKCKVCGKELEVQFNWMPNHVGKDGKTICQGSSNKLSRGQPLTK